jgi:hypothetical protein
VASAMLLAAHLLRSQIPAHSEEPDTAARDTRVVRAGLARRARRGRAPRPVGRARLHATTGTLSSAWHAHAGAGGSDARRGHTGNRSAPGTVRPAGLDAVVRALLGSG